MNLTEYGLGDTLTESLEAYVEHGRPTGGFLEAVLSNDLMAAFRRADAENLARLRLITAAVYNQLPAPCWGSRAKVAAWVERGGLGQP